MWEDDLKFIEKLNNENKELREEIKQLKDVLKKSGLMKDEDSQLSNQIYRVQKVSRNVVPVKERVQIMKESIKKKIMFEITDFCESCSSRECCCECDCVLYRIEKIVEGRNENIQDRDRRNTNKSN